MLVPKMRTWSVGDLDAAALLNSQIRDAINFLLVPPSAKTRQTVTQSLANGSFAAITFDVEDLDTDNMHVTTPAAQTSRLTATTAGWYATEAGVAFASNATGVRSITFYINGVPQQGRVLVSAVSGSTTEIAISNEFYLNAGDYLEVWAFQSSGAALSTAYTSGSTGSYFNARRYSS